MSSRPLDIQLLVVFDAVLSERNVTRAARRINLSQSATSKALARLRTVFGDALFLRTSAGVAPTHRALELAPRIQEALSSARDLLDPRAAFDPTRATTEFNIAASDYVSFVLMPALLPLLARHAPAMRITVHDLEKLTAEEMLLAGKVDLAIASVARVSRPLTRQELFRDDFVCVSRLDHPRVGRRMSLTQFASSGHLVIPRQNGGGMSVVDDALSQHELTRDVVATIPHCLGIPKILLGADLLATVPARLGRFLSDSFAIQVHRHPLKLAPFVVSQLWHDRTANSPSHRWLRATIAKLCASL